MMLNDGYNNYFQKIENIHSSGITIIVFNSIQNSLFSFFNILFNQSMFLKRRSYLQFRYRILSRANKQKNDQKQKCSPQKDQGKEENFQNLFSYYLSLIDLNVFSKAKEGDNLDQIRVKRVNAFMNPYQFKYLTKALLKIPEINEEEALKFQSVINFFHHLHSEKPFSPHFSPSLLNNLRKFQENLHNCESLNKNNYFIKNLSLAYDTQLRSDEVPFLLIKESEFMKDIDDKENKLKGMICGLANHHGGYIIICQSFTKNRITGGLKEISKTFIDSIATGLNVIARKEDIGIEVQLKRLKSLKYKIDEEETDEEHVILIHVKINQQKFSNGFYIDRKQYNELYKLSFQNKDIQKLKSKYEKIIDAMVQKFPKLKIKKLEEQVSSKNIQPLKRLFWEQCENEWVCKEVKEYEEIRKIMKFNMKKQALKEFKVKQMFIPGITFQKVDLKLSDNKDNHLRQICNYFMWRKQSKKEIAQFFSQIPNQNSVGLIVRGEKMQMYTVNKILEDILKMTKTPYKIIVPFPELQQKIGEKRRQKSNTIQNYYYYYVRFQGNFQRLNQEFKKKLNKYDIKQVTMGQVQLKSPKIFFLMTKDWKILSKTIYHFFDIEPQFIKGAVDANPIIQQNIQYCPTFFQGEHKVDLQEQQKKFSGPKFNFKNSELHASLFCIFLLLLSNKIRYS